MVTRKKPEQTTVVDSSGKPVEVFTLGNRTVAIPKSQLPQIQEPEADPDNEEENQDDGYDEDDEVLRIQALLGEVEGESVAHLYRVPNQGGKNVYLTEYPVAEFSFKSVQSSYGAGKYLLRVHTKGRRGLAMAPTTFEIGAPIETAASPTTTVSLSDQIAQAVARALPPSPPPPPAFDPMEMIIKAAPVLKLIKDMLTPAPAPNSTPRSSVEMMQEMMMMQDLMEQMAERREKRAESPSDLSRIIDAATPVIQAITSRGAQPEAAQEFAEPQPMQPQQLQSPQPPQQPQEEDPMNIMLRASIQMILRAAEKNEPVEPWGERILGIASDDQIEQFFGDTNVNPEFWWENLIQVAPGAVAHRPWFEKLHEYILSIYYEEESDSEGDPTGVSAKRDEPGAPAKSPASSGGNSGRG